MGQKKNPIDVEKIDWTKAVDEWCSKIETGGWADVKLEKMKMTYSLIKKKFPFGLGSGSRQSSNPNPEEVVYEIIVDSDFYHRNKHRFEFIQACYQSRGYGYEFYWRSIQPPKEVNIDGIKRNRTIVCKRMITTLNNKITAFEKENEKLLFPMWDNKGYLRLKEKRDNYQQELDNLTNKI